MEPERTDEVDARLGRAGPNVEARLCPCFRRLVEQDDDAGDDRRHRQPCGTRQADDGRLGRSAHGAQNIAVWALTVFDAIGRASRRSFGMTSPLTTQMP